MHSLVLDNQLTVLLLAWLWGVAWLERKGDKAPWPFITASVLLVISLDMLWGGIKLSALPVMAAGHDWLTYTCMAIDNLRDFSLEGGEPVFYYQPLYRYWLAFLHVIFGDSYYPLRILESAAVCLLSLAAAYPFLRGMLKRGEIWLGALISGLLLFLATHEFLPASAYRGLSETPFLVFWLGFVLLWQHKRSAALMALFLGLAALTRMNLLAACLAGLGACFIGQGRIEPQKALRALSVFALLMLLPLLHNLYYAGAAVWLPQSAAHSSNIIISLSDNCQRSFRGQGLGALEPYAFLYERPIHAHRQIALLCLAIRGVQRSIGRADLGGLYLAAHPLAENRVPHAAAPDGLCPLHPVQGG